MESSALWPKPLPDNKAGKPPALFLSDEDNMEKKHIMIIAVTTAVVILAVAAIVVLGNGGNSNNNLEPIKLSIYGNANEDYAIDQKDIDLVNDLIGDESKWADYPYADANGDGKISSADVDVINAVIKGQSTKLRLIDQYIYATGENHIAEIDYPLRNIVTINPDMAQLTYYFDGDHNVAGYIANLDSYEKSFYKMTNNGFSVCLGTTPRSIGTSEWQELIKLDNRLHDKNEGIGGILAYNDAALGDYKDDIEDARIPIIYLRCTDPLHSIDATVLLGLLMGPEYAKKALDFAADCRAAIVDIEDRLTYLKDEDRVHFVALCMWSYMSEHESQYTKIGLEAGGIDEANLPGNASTPISDVEAITKFNNSISTILNCRTCDLTEVSAKTLWENSKLDILKKSTHFEDMFFLNLSIPVPCRIMYTVSMFYPDLITVDECDEYFQMIVDKYLSYLNETVTDGYFDVRKDTKCVITWQDYLDDGGSEDDPTHIDSDIDPREYAIRFFDIMGDDLNTVITGADYEYVYSYGPYAIDPDSDDQHAIVGSQGNTYSVKYTLMENPKEKYEETIQEYIKKIGTEFRGGTYIQIPYITGLTQCMGYYLNTNPESPTSTTVFGSIKFCGYIDEMFVELNMLKRPNLTDADIQKLIDAVYPSASDVDTKAWASAIDSDVFSEYAGAPYTLKDGATSTSARIEAADSGSGDRHVEFNSSGSALTEFSKMKSNFEEKVKGYEGTSTRCYLVNGTEFDDAYGYVSDRVKGGTFMCWMVYFAGMKDGCCVDICLRSDDPNYSVSDFEIILEEILSTEP